MCFQLASASNVSILVTGLLFFLFLGVCNTFFPVPEGPYLCFKMVRIVFLLIPSASTTRSCACLTANKGPPLTDSLSKTLYPKIHHFYTYKLEYTPISENITILRSGWLSDAGKTSQNFIYGFEFIIFSKDYYTAGEIQ